MLVGEAWAREGAHSAEGRANGGGPDEEFTGQAIGMARVRADPLGYLGQVQEFVESVRTNTPPHSADLHAGARAARMAIGAFESIRTGEPQEL